MHCFAGRQKLLCWVYQSLTVELNMLYFPHLANPAAASNANKWKWSDIGLTPVMHVSVNHA